MGPHCSFCGTFTGPFSEVEGLFTVLICIPCLEVRLARPDTLLGLHDPGDPWFQWGCPIGGCGKWFIGPWYLEWHTAAEHPGWTATYELLRPYRTSACGSCTGRSRTRLADWPRRPGPGPANQPQRRRRPNAHMAVTARATSIAITKTTQIHCTGDIAPPPGQVAHCWVGSCHSGPDARAVGAAAPPPNKDSGPRGAPFQRGQAPGLLVARRRRTLHPWRPGPAGLRPQPELGLRVPPGEVVPIGTPLAAELGGGRVHGGPGPRRRSSG